LSERREIHATDHSSDADDGRDEVSHQHCDEGLERKAQHDGHGKVDEFADSDDVADGPKLHSITAPFVSSEQALPVFWCANPRHCTWLKQQTQTPRTPPTAMSAIAIVTSQR
jgi:hypothetical protein